MVGGRLLGVQQGQDPLVSVWTGLIWTGLNHNLCQAAPCGWAGHSRAPPRPGGGANPTTVRGLAPKLTPYAASRAVHTTGTRTKQTIARWL